MSIKAVEWARRQLGRPWEEPDPTTGELKRRSLGPRHVLGLVEMADCINKRMTFAFPGPERLERATGLGERQQRRLIRDLEASGAIKAVQGKGRGRGRGREPNRYYLACDPATGADRPLPAEAFTAPKSTLRREVELSQAGAVTAGQKSPAVTRLQPDADDRYTRSCETTPSLYQEKPELNREENVVAHPAMVAALTRGFGRRAPAAVQLCDTDRAARLEELRRMAAAEQIATEGGKV